MKCNRCGESFSCGANETKCWCESFALLSPIPKQYKDCLCQACLNVFQVKNVTASGDGLAEGEDFYFTPPNWSAPGQRKTQKDALKSVGKRLWII